MGILVNISKQQALLDDLLRSKAQLNANATPQPVKTERGAIADYLREVQAWEKSESDRLRQLDLTNQEIQETEQELQRLEVEHKKAITRCQPAIAELESKMVEFNRLSFELRQLSSDIKQRGYDFAGLFDDAYGSTVLTLWGWQPHQIPTMRRVDDSQPGEGYWVAIPSWVETAAEVEQYQPFIQNKTASEVAA
jgi:hypothetical protein